MVKRQAAVPLSISQKIGCTWKSSAIATRTASATLLSQLFSEKTFSAASNVNGFMSVTSGTP